MKTLFDQLVLFLLVIMVVSCAGSKNQPTKDKLNPDQQNIKELFVKDPQNYTKRVLADKCRIIGTIKDIDSTRFLEDPEAPCGKVPCHATIIIKQVLGYGSGFSSKLYKGEELEVNFKFTLVPTDEIAPELKLGLPGLKEGNDFIADLEALPLLGKGKVEYTIYRYELKLD